MKVLHHVLLTRYRIFFNVISYQSYPSPGRRLVAFIHWYTVIRNQPNAASFGVENNFGLKRMDYHSLPRKQLQALCKKHAIPANSTNVLMADALAALFNDDENTKLSGDEGLRKEELTSQERAESVLTEIFNTPRRNIRSKRHGAAAEDGSGDEPDLMEIELTSSALKQRVTRSAHRASGRKQPGAVNEDAKGKAKTRGRPKEILDDGLMNKEGSLHSSDLDESSDAFTAHNSVKVETGRNRRGRRNAKSCKTITGPGTDTEEFKQGSDEKEHETDETNDESVEEAPKSMLKSIGTQKGRCKRIQLRRKSDEVEEALEESNQEADDSNREVTPICKRSTRARAGKVVDSLLGQRSSTRKKTGDVDSMKKTPGTSSRMTSARKTRRSKSNSMRIESTDKEDEDDPEEKAVHPSAKRSLTKSLSKNDTMKTPVQTRRMLRCHQPKDSTEHPSEDCLEESASKVNRVSTRRRQNSNRIAHHVVDPDRQERSNSELEDSDVKQERVSARKIVRKSTVKRRGKELEALPSDLIVEEVKEIVEEGILADKEATEEMKLMKIKGESLDHQEQNLCQVLNQKLAVSDIYQAASIEAVENKSVVGEPCKTSPKNRETETTVSETLPSREVEGDKPNICKGEVIQEQGNKNVLLHEEEAHIAMQLTADGGNTHLSSPGKGELCGLPSVKQLGIEEIQESSLLEQKTVNIAAEESTFENIFEQPFSHNTEAQALAVSGPKDDDCQENIGENGMLESVGASDVEDREEIVPSGFNANADATYLNCINSRKFGETEELLIRDENDPNLQLFDCSKEFSYSVSGNEAGKSVEQSTEFPHMDSEDSSFKARPCFFEAQGKEVAELDHMVDHDLNSSDEDSPDSEAVPSNNLNFGRGRIQLKRCLMNLVEESNYNTTEGKLRVFYNSSFLIDEVHEEISSDLDKTEEEDQGAHDSTDSPFRGMSNTLEFEDHGVSDLQNVEGQYFNISKEVESIGVRLDAEAVSSNDLKKQTQLQHTSGIVVEETRYSKTEETMLVSNITSFSVDKVHEEVLGGLDTIDVEDKDAHDSVPEALMKVSSSHCQEADPATNMTLIPADADIEPHPEEFECVLDKPDDSDRAQGISHSEPNLLKSLGTEGLIYCMVEDSLVESKQVHEGEDRVFMDYSQKTIDTLEYGKQDAGSRIFCGDDDSKTTLGQLVAEIILRTEEEGHTLNQVSDDQAAPIVEGDSSAAQVDASICQSVGNIDRLESQVMATIEGSTIKNQIGKFDTEDETVQPPEKVLPGIGTQGSEHNTIANVGFLVEANDEISPIVVEDTSILEKICIPTEVQVNSSIEPCLNTRCSEVSCTSFQEASQELSVMDSSLTGDKVAITIIEREDRVFDGEDRSKDFFHECGSVQHMKEPVNTTMAMQKAMEEVLMTTLTDMPEQSREDEHNTILDHGLHSEYLEPARCHLQGHTQKKTRASPAREQLDLSGIVITNQQSQAILDSESLQVEKENSLNLNTLSLRKLRSLCKEKEVRTKEAEKVGKRFALQDLSSNKA
eukprot:Gb_36700 [translate_table: standard]